MYIVIFKTHPRIRVSVCCELVFKEQNVWSLFWQKIVSKMIQEWKGLLTWGRSFYKVLYSIHQLTCCTVSSQGRRSSATVASIRVRQRALESVGAPSQLAIRLVESAEISTPLAPVFCRRLGQVNNCLLGAKNICFTGSVAICVVVSYGFSVLDLLRENALRSCFRMFSFLYRRTISRWNVKFFHFTRQLDIISLVVHSVPKIVFREDFELKNTNSNEYKLRTLSLRSPNTPRAKVGLGYTKLRRRM